LQLKLAFLADIHGNYDALKAVVNELPSVDRLVVLGDVLGYYPFFGLCLDEMEKAGAEYISGNHEAYQMNLLQRPAQPIFDWFYGYFEENASDRDRYWLENLQVEKSLKLQEQTLKFFHGSPWSISEYIYSDFSEWSRFDDLDEDIIVLGHTHVPMDLYWNKKRIINPGSVGQPRDGNPQASYAIYDDESQKLQFFRINYDAHRLIEVMHDLGHDEKCINILLSPGGKV
jgi:putative phosphoesterase